MCTPCDPPEDSKTHPAFFFSRGPGTYQVQSPLPVAARAKLVAALARKGHITGAILLRGGISATRNDTDHEELFRQESYFAHLFGVVEPDCWGIIELPSGRATLLVPRLAPAYAVWMGEILPPEHFRKRYHTDACAYADETMATLRVALGSSTGPVHVLSGSNSDSGLDIAAILPTAECIPPDATVDAPLHRMLMLAEQNCSNMFSPNASTSLSWSRQIREKNFGAAQLRAKTGPAYYFLNTIWAAVGRRALPLIIS